jgi:S-adenosylmethionine hydrolase
MGEIAYVDRFGNAIANIDTAALAQLGKRPLKIFVGDQELCELKKFYREVPPVAVIGSSNFLEIAIHGGNAARQLDLKIGDPIGVL